MTAEAKGRDLFIVDNSVSGWTGLRYLEEWTGIAKAFDIATGYFEIGSLLALDGKWQALEKIRVLMGAEMTHCTRKALPSNEQTDWQPVQEPYGCQSAPKTFHLSASKTFQSSELFQHCFDDEPNGACESHK